MLHPVLRRQLRKLDLAAETLPADLEDWQTLLARVAQVYQDVDRDRYLLERSLAVSSQEMEALYASLRRANEELESRVQERTADLARTNAELAAEVVERRRAEEGYAQSEARLSALLRTVSDIITVLEPDGTMRYHSPSVERVLGYLPDELVGGNVLELIYPEDAGAAETFLAARSGDDAPSAPTELRFRHRDGGWRHLECIGSHLVHDPSVTGIVVTARDITERKQFEARLAHQAYHDSLTDLPNRSLFMDRLQHALARAGAVGGRVALMFLDLDNFKIVNDSLGHSAGDELLIAAADRIRSCVRAGDTVARLGGDEFTVLFEDVDGVADAIEAAERIGARLAEPLRLGGQEVFVSTSIGIAASSEGAVAEDLLRNADLALYQAKSHGRACYRVFDPAMNARALERLRLETELRHATERRELRLVYQPIVELASGQVAEVEALLRWQHPERGLVSPAEFIPLAEETGLILPIGRWVLEEACRQAREWQARCPGSPPIVVGVNLSARQFQQPSLVRDVLAALQRTGLAPQLLKLEITESVAMADAESAVAALRELRTLGVSLAIDDFGTGYSGLSYLKRFPVTTLKVDRSFVDGLGTDPDDTGIVRAIVALAKTLGMTVTAEGIESSEQLDLLRELECEYGQGFYFARPLPPGDVETLIQDAAGVAA